MMPATAIPILLDLAGKNILLVGAGAVAARKLLSLTDRKAKITILASQVSPAVLKQAKGRVAKILKRAYKKSDLKGRDLVFALTQDATLNQKIASACAKRGVLCNSATEASQSFLMTSFFERGDLVLAVSTRGAVPFLAKAVRRHLEKLFDASWALRVVRLKSLRARLIKSSQLRILKRLAKMTLEQLKQLADKGEAYLDD